MKTNEMSLSALTRFTYLMRKLERLTGESSILIEFEEKYMNLENYDRALVELCCELQCQVNQLAKDLK